VEETSIEDGKRGSISTSTENAEMEETRTEDGKSGTISTSPENDEAEETQTTGSGCASIKMCTENAKVDKIQTTDSKHESINMSTENADVEEKQVADSGLVNGAHPRRRQRLDLESVAQLEQLKVDMREQQEKVRLQLDRRRLDLESRTELLNTVIANLKYQSCFKELSERTNISLPLFPEPSSVLSSLLATSRTGGSPVNLGVNGAASVHVDSSEDHGVNDADNSHLNPLEDTINNANMAQRDSSENA